MSGEREHTFRMPKVRRSLIGEVQAAFAQRERANTAAWRESRDHKRVIQDGIAARVVGEGPIDAAMKASLVALEVRARERMATLHRVTFERPHTFNLHPGLNVIAPPYDFTLKVAEGTQKPAVSANAKTGGFWVSATSMSGPTAYSTAHTAGAAGVGFVIVPTHPSRTVSIRPYFRYSYRYACESHGTPTAHSRGFVAAAVTGHRGGKRTEYPLKDVRLWSNGSDFWDDVEGEGEDLFRNPEAEHVVSGHDFYTVLYSCRCGGDSARTRIGFWSAAFMGLWCEVPFVAIREF